MTRLSPLPHVVTRRPRRSGGYVLLMVLLVLTISAAAAAGVCRMSLDKALRAARAEDDLQRRWGALSCRTTLLPKAERVLTAAEQPGSKPSAEARLQLPLGRQTFTLIFGDEQAKANVNALYYQGGLAGTERAVRELTAASGSPAPVELRPSAGGAAADPEDREPVFESFGQVFGGAPPAALLAGRPGRPAPASQLTCWSDGPLNFRRASRDALVQVCRPHVGRGRVEQLLKARDETFPDVDLAGALDSLGLNQKQQAALEDLLVDDSVCYSLWVISRDGGREWYDLAVDGAAGEADRVYFTW